MWRVMLITGTTNVPTIRNRHVPNNPFEETPKEEVPQPLVGQGEEGVPVEEVRPGGPTNDAFQYTLTPPRVGARLSQFREALEGVTTDTWTLNIIIKGYLPEFKSLERPKLSYLY